MERPEPEPVVTQSFTCVPWFSLPSMGWGRIPRCRAEALRIGAELVLFPLSVLSPSSQRGAVLEPEEPARVLGVGWNVDWDSLGTPVRARDGALPASTSASNGHVDLFTGIAGSEPPLYPPKCILSLAMAAWP